LELTMSTDQPKPSGREQGLAEARKRFGAKTAQTDVQQRVEDRLRRLGVTPGNGAGGPVEPTPLTVQEKAQARLRRMGLLPATDTPTSS
jgi:hypothetical protein